MYLGAAGVWVGRIVCVKTYLDEIAQHHRERARNDLRTSEVLKEAAISSPKPLSLKAEVARSSSVALIAEIKRRSPSKGQLNGSLNVEKTLLEYVQGGATGISVLTDEKYFDGSLADLAFAAGVVELPILRKDFVVDKRDLYDAKIHGASAVLLIVAMLDVGEIEDLLAEAYNIGLDALVEVHTKQELKIALDSGASFIGVNQRNLFTFEVDGDLAVSVIAEIPDGVVKVAESGISDVAQVERLAQVGCDGILVGETLVRSADVVDTVRRLSCVARP